MRQLLALKSRTRPDPKEDAHVVNIEEPEGRTVLDTLGSDTTREIFEAVRSEARTATEVADVVDTSLQNAKYHLEKLENANLIETGDTWYSEQGNEMPVYAATSESLVLFAGPEDGISKLQEFLPETITALFSVVIGGVLVDQIAPVSTTTYTSGGDAMLPAWIPINEFVSVLSPGSLFVIGGVTAVIIFVISSFIRS